MAVTQTAGSNASVPALAELDALVTLKMRMGVGIVFLQTNWRDEARFAAGKRRLLRIATEAYFPSLAEMVAHQGRALIEVHRDQVKARLHRGWGVPGDRADELFAELLTQYEVLQDALWLGSENPATQPLAVLQARIDAIEAVR